MNKSIEYEYNKNTQQLEVLFLNFDNDSVIDMAFKDVPGILDAVKLLKDNLV